MSPSISFPVSLILSVLGVGLTSGFVPLSLDFAILCLRVSEKEDLLITYEFIQHHRRENKIER